MIYTTNQLLDDLKLEAQILSGNVFTNKIMSELLTGQKGRHYEIKKTLVKNYEKKGKTYLISLEVLKEYKKNLKSVFKNEYMHSNFEKIFSSYCQANILKEYTLSTLNYNPNLNLNYFEIIDSEEKAYWLGWLFAEGHITKHGGLQIEIGLKDEILALEFAKTIGFKQSNLKYRTRINDSKSKTVLITFQNSYFTGHLIKKGFPIGKKSGVITLPNFGDIQFKNIREQYLAFLLGYFDGDGQQGSSRIYSNSYQFLYQIKEKFKIKSKISKWNYMTKDGNQKTKYMIFLTADLFNEMLYNYKNSLKRKRIRLIDSMLRAEQLEKARAKRQNKFLFSTETLQNLLFKMPKTQIALLHQKIFGIKIGRTTVDRYARKWGLKMPPMSYWKGRKGITSNLEEEF